MQNCFIEKPSAGFPTIDKNQSSPLLTCRREWEALRRELWWPSTAPTGKMRRDLFLGSIETGQGVTVLS